MKKKTEPSEDEHELEVIKAVAQAWLGHTATASPPTNTSEFDARRLNFKNKSTRFKTEAMSKPSRTDECNGLSTSWDFKQSLWDSYEIVTVSRRLETGLLLGHEFDESGQGQGHGQTRKIKKESKNSLRNVFKRTSSSRFDE